MKSIVSLIAAIFTTSLIAAAPAQAADGHAAGEHGNPHASVPYLGNP